MKPQPQFLIRWEDSSEHGAVTREAMLCLRHRGDRAAICPPSQLSPAEARAWSSRVEESLRRARPLPPHEEMVIDDLTEEEGAAFLSALEA